MRTIDIYRGIKPPCQEFDPYPNPAYQAALHEASLILNELAKYNVPQELIFKIDEAHNKLTATEVDLMWCFAFEKGMAFQRNLTLETKDFDIAVEETE